MTFSDKGACNSHQRTHTGEERAACPVCEVVFSKKQKLKYHMRIHTREGLETCHICDKVAHLYTLIIPTYADHYISLSLVLRQTYQGKPNRGLTEENTQLGIISAIGYNIPNWVFQIPNW